MPVPVKVACDLANQPVGPFHLYYESLAKVFVEYALFSCQKQFSSSYGSFNSKLQLEAFNSFVFVFLSLFLNVGIPLLLLFNTPQSPLWGFLLPPLWKRGARGDFKLIKFA